MEAINEIEHVKDVLKKRPEVLFAYIHGSALYSEKPRDIDVAIFLYPGVYKKLFIEGEVNIELAIPIEMELARRVGGRIDLQVLNGAPLSFQYRVISQGELIIDNDEIIRCDFEYLTRVKYFDFRPRREEYLREVMAS